MYVKENRMNSQSLSANNQTHTGYKVLQALCLFNCYSNMLHEIACNITNYCTNGQQNFHKLKASENVVHECNNRDTQAKQCNKIFIHHESCVTMSHHSTDSSHSAHHIWH